MTPATEPCPGCGDPDCPARRLLVSEYACRACGNRWHGEWCSAVDDTCGRCGRRNIGPHAWEEVEDATADAGGSAH